MSLTAVTLNLQYLPLEKLTVEKPVDRLSFLGELVRDLLVLDLGAYDDDASREKKQSSRWLHLRLANSAQRVLGVDNSPRLPRGGLITSEKSQIRFGSVYELQTVTAEFKWDIAVAGEIIEHLPNTSDFLKHVRERVPSHKCRIAVTTPNATSAHNIVLGLFSKESCHRDHLQLYSFKTLRTLFERSGWTVERMVPYHLEIHEILVGAGPLKALWIRFFRAIVHIAESWVPLWAAGWIVVARPQEGFRPASTE